MSIKLEKGGEPDLATDKGQEPVTPASTGNLAANYEQATKALYGEDNIDSAEPDSEERGVEAGQSAAPVKPVLFHQPVSHWRTADDYLDERDRGTGRWYDEQRARGN